MSTKKPIQPTTTAVPEAMLASFDLGNATSKIKTANLSVEFRSIAGRLSQKKTFGEIKSPLCFVFEGETLVFGDDCRDLIDGEPMAYTDMRRYTDGFYRKLFAAALWRSFKPIANSETLYPIIVCSIPVSEYADGKADEVKNNLLGEYVIEDIHGLAIYIDIKAENLVIIPEGAGAYFQALYAPDSNLASREVAIIDVGFYTTDLVIFNKGSYVTGSAQSAKHGMRQIAERVHRFLRKQHHYEGDLWMVDSVLGEGCIEIGRKCYSFIDERDNGYADLLDDINAFYRSSKGSRTPGAVVLSGGGAAGLYLFLPDTLRDEGWRVANNPRRANADGAFMFLERREKARTNS